MVLIPPDAGVRLRMQTEASLLQPVQRTHEIPAELPELQPGQSFTARIQEALPDNLYKALVAGKALTLQLPEGAKSGDLLELVVVDRTAGAVIAQRAGTETAPGAAAEPYPYATLSRAAQMISQLLLPEGETPKSAPLNGGQPLLARPPGDAAELVPTLAKAVGESGLFYEAHQAQWVAGGRSTEALRLEPQARQSVSGAPVQAEKAPPSPPPSLLQTIFGGGEKAEASVPQQQAASLAQAVPDPLRPLVQQQLDAVASQRLAWHGEVWPGQTMDWEIERERVTEGEGQGDADGQRWSTRLRLTMPRLGTVDALLQLAPEGLRVRLTTAGDSGAADLRQGGPQLAAALTGAGLRLTGLEVRNENGQPR